MNGDDVLVVLGVYEHDSRARLRYLDNVRADRDRASGARGTGTTCAFFVVRYPGKLTKTPPVRTLGPIQTATWNASWGREGDEPTVYLFCCWGMNRVPFSWVA